MSNRMKKLVSLLAVAVMAVSVFAGCGNTDDKQSASEPGSSSVQQEESSSSDVVEEEPEFTYPMDPVVELTINYGSDLADPNNDNPNEHTEVLAAGAGVILTSNGVSSGSSADDFLLMLVSGDLPDIIVNNFAKHYVGGAAAAIDEGHIIDLTDYAEYMPNYLAWLEANPYYKQWCYTEDGRLFNFVAIEDQSTGWDRGIVLRKDVLDDLGLKVPVTIDDFYNVLKTVKEKTDMIPFATELRWMWEQCMSSSVSGAFDTCYPYYTLDGKTVKFAMYEDGMKAFLQEMNKWYAEGLIDPNLASAAKGDVRGGLANGTVFAANQAANNSVASLQACEIEGAEFVAIPQLVMKEGDTRYNFNSSGYITTSGRNFSISTDCENIEAAIRFCDYMFTEEGHMRYNYGLEGLCWEYDENGEVVLTDLMTKDPERSAGDLRWTYAKATSWAGWGEGALLYKDPVEKEFIEVFQKDLVLAGVGYKHNDEENNVIAQYDADMQTYAKEVITNLILGNTSFDQWETIKDNFKNSYHADELLAVKQSAWDRFLEVNGRK